MGFVFLLFLSLCLLFRYVFISTVESPTLVDFCEFLSVFFFFKRGDIGEGQGKLRPAREQFAVAVTVGGADQITEC
jgi:hypothetical protein